MDNVVWVEKYRPKTINDVLLPDTYRVDFERLIKEKEIPHLLFFGPPGGGKTTLARILTTKGIILENPRDNCLRANGSAQSQRNISFVENVIEPFMRGSPAGRVDKIRIVFIDEADKMTKDAYDALRGHSEAYVENARFIFTCNYIGKIPEPLQSRFGSGIYKFDRLPHEFVLEYCKKILNSEKIEFKEDDINHVIKELYPDIRRIIGALQRFSYSGNLNVNKEEQLNISKYVIGLTLECFQYAIKGDMKNISNNIDIIIKTLAENDLAYDLLYEELFLNPKVSANAKIFINRFSLSHQSCLIPHMNYAAMIYETVKIINQYEKLK